MIRFNRTKMATVAPRRFASLPASAHELEGTGLVDRHHPSGPACM